MKELLKKLWEGVNGLSAVDFSETGISFVKDDLELQGRTQEKPENDVRDDEEEDSEFNPLSEYSEFNDWD